MAETHCQARIRDYLNHLETDILDHLLDGTEATAQGDQLAAARQLAHATALLSAALNLCRLFPEMKVCRTFGTKIALSTETGIRQAIHRAGRKDYRSC